VRERGEGREREIRRERERERGGKRVHLFIPAYAT